MKCQQLRHTYEVIIFLDYGCQSYLSCREKLEFSSKKLFRNTKKKKEIFVNFSFLDFISYFVISLLLISSCLSEEKFKLLHTMIVKCPFTIFDRKLKSHKPSYERIKFNILNDFWQQLSQIFVNHLLKTLSDAVRH